MGGTKRDGEGELSSALPKMICCFSGQTSPPAPSPLPSLFAQMALLAGKGEVTNFQM